MLSLLELSRQCEDQGRRKLRSFSPRKVASGVWHLARHYVMELTNSHAVLHGGYESLTGGATLAAADHVWDNTPDEEDWLISHAQGHHRYTNRVGRDDDLGYSLFRVSDLQPYRWYHLLQPLFLFLMPFVESIHFPFYIAAARARIEGRRVYTWETVRRGALKVLQHWRINYVQEPIKARGAALQVLLGNFIARHIANVIIVVMLSCEHLNGRVLDLESTDEPLDRDEFYLQQLLTSASFTISETFEAHHSLGVSLHIEHHLFPRMPIGRLPAIRESIKELCARFDVPYDCEPWYRALLAVTKTVVTHSVPWAKPCKARVKRRECWQQWRDEHRARRSRFNRVLPVELHDIHLARSRVTLTARSDENLLEALERAGVEVPSLCRRGACGTCETPLLDGDVEQYGHAEHDRTVRPCSAKARSDLLLDL